MKHIPLFLFTALLLLGCSREEYSPSETFPSGGKFTFTVSPMKGETQTKSSFAPGTSLLRTSIYMLAYQNGALVEGCSGYWADHNDLVTHFEDGQAYDLYFLMNTTRFIGDDWKAGELDLRSEANLASLTYAIDSYSVFNATGFPMAGVYKNWVSGVSPRNFELDRQISRIVLKLKDLKQSNVHLTVKSVTLHQAARKIRPFGASFAAASEDDIISKATLISDTDAADHASANDIVVLQDKGEILLYMLENMQGDLLAGNTDHWNKIPKYIQMSEDPAISSKAGLVTYVDINCSATTQASTVGDIHYSICLGDNTTTNFDIHRNYESSLDVTYVTDNIIDHEWKQTSKDWDRNGGYYVVDRNIASDYRPVSICPGISDQITIACTGRDNFIKIDPSRTTFTGDTDKVFYSISQDGDKYNVSFSTTRTFNENTTVLEMGDEAPYTMATLTLYSDDAYNGDSNASISIPVRIYDCIFPIQFRYNDRTGYLEARSNNPMGLGFRFFYNGSVSGRNFSGTSYCVDVNAADGLTAPSPSLNKTWQQVGDLGMEITATSGMILNIDVTPYSSNMRMPFPYGNYSMQGSAMMYVPNKPCFEDGAELYKQDPKVIHPYGLANFGPNTYPSGWSFSGGTGGSTHNYVSSDYSYGYYQGSSEMVEWSIYRAGFWAARSSGGTTYNRVDVECYNYFDHITSSSDFYNRRTYYSTCPFYVCNGDLGGYDKYVRINGLSGDTEWAHIELLCREPGRDLFEHYGVINPTGLDFVGRVGLSVWCKQQLFNVHFWTAQIPYTYGVHMTINGKTSWPLANTTLGGASW